MAAINVIHKPKPRWGYKIVPGKAEYANHAWTYDFIFDATGGGRMLKVLTVVDEHARQALAATVGRSLTSACVRKEFELLFSAHGRPAALRCRQLFKAAASTTQKTRPHGSVIRSMECLR